MTTAAQGNITSVGVLTSLSTTGNVDITGNGRLVAAGITKTNWSFTPITLNNSSNYPDGSTRVYVCTGTGGNLLMFGSGGGSSTTPLTELYIINKCSGNVLVTYSSSGDIGTIPSGATGTLTMAAANISSAAGWALSVGTSSLGLGQGGQTWQNLTASRSLAATYTNSTGRPIQVSIYFLGSTQSNFTVNGLTIASNSSSTGWMTVSEVIPPNATYSLVDINGGLSYLNWYELR